MSMTYSLQYKSESFNVLYCILTAYSSTLRSARCEHPQPRARSPSKNSIDQHLTCRPQAHSWYGRRQQTVFEVGLGDETPKKVYILTSNGVDCSVYVHNNYVVADRWREVVRPSVITACPWGPNDTAVSRGGQRWLYLKASLTLNQFFFKIVQLHDLIKLW